MFFIDSENEYNIEILKASVFSEKNNLIHGFSLRCGGVSGIAGNELNVSPSREQGPMENVGENIGRVCRILGLDYGRLTRVNHVHGDNIIPVDEKNCGSGVSKPFFEAGADAMITNVPGIPLMTIFCDCVPVLLYDEKNKVIGAVHSGWRGTKLYIAGKTVQAMTENYGCNPENIKAVIGPSIRQCCFEVDRPVYEEILSAFSYLSHNDKIFKKGKTEGKFNISLQALVKEALAFAGVLENNIFDSGICTCCPENAEHYFSHRREKGKCGIHGGFIMIKE